jgi:hypothetical protein
MGTRLEEEIIFINVYDSGGEKESLLLVLHAVLISAIEPYDSHLGLALVDASTSLVSFVTGRCMYWRFDWGLWSLIEGNHG